MLPTPSLPLVLASASPRRAKILRALGVPFTTAVSHAPEVCHPDDPVRTVRENALTKGAALAAPGRRVLSADTIVWRDGRIFGKPRDDAEAKAMLRVLAGRTHTVFTAVACDGTVTVARADVTFRALTDAAIDAYVARVRPLDRAGAYDIDAAGDDLIASYTGTYETIMGLPVDPLIGWGLLPPAPPAAGDGPAIRGVVFDFGGVMTTTTMPERVRAIVTELGIDWSVIEEGFARYRRRMDGNLMSLEEMYTRIWADAAIRVSPADTARILAADSASYLSRNEETLAWMRALKARGLRLGILTNMHTGFALLFRRHFADFIALADALVISGEERLYKPQRAIYDLLARRIGLPGEALCFIDDVGSNCKGACAAGWQAIRFTTTAAAAAELEGRLSP